MRHFASDVFTARGIDFRFRAPDAEQNIKVGANVRRELFLLFKEAVNNIVGTRDALAHCSPRPMAAASFCEHRSRARHRSTSKQSHGLGAEFKVGVGASECRTMLWTGF